MDDHVRDALANDRTIDITTMGRTSGLPRRIETWFYRVDDEIYLTGLPGRRDWYANLLANPDFTFHLKQSLWPTFPLGRPQSPTLRRGAPSSNSSSRTWV